MIKTAVLISFAILATIVGTAFAQDAADGGKLYASYCVACHGDKGKGDGSAANALPVKPANLADGTAMGQLPDKFLAEIISRGGAAVGKSPIMPGVGSQLNEKQIRDLVAYVRSLSSGPGK